MAHKTAQSVGDVTSKLLSMRYNNYIAAKRCYDNWFLKQWWEDKKNERLRYNQKISFVSHKELGPDLAASKFFVGYCRGQVKNQDDRWLTSLGDLPQSYDQNFQVTAINARNASIITEGIDNFIGLDHLEAIDLSSNPKLDDFACDQLAKIFRRSRTLKFIDLSHNPFISVYGLDILFRIPSLTKIIAIGTRASKYEDIDLFTMAAQDEKLCDVFVREDGRQFENDELEETRTLPTLISSQ